MKTRTNSGAARMWLSIVALTGAAGVALLVSGTLAPEPRPPGSDIGDFERDLLPLRDSLRPGDHVALIVKDEDVECIGCPIGTAYVLAPAIVVNVKMRAAECAGSPSSCVLGATHLLLANPDVEAASALGSVLGFVPVSISRGGVLLARTPR